MHLIIYKDTYFNREISDLGSIGELIGEAILNFQRESESCNISLNMSIQEDDTDKNTFYLSSIHHLE